MAPQRLSPERHKAWFAALLHPSHSQVLAEKGANWKPTRNTERCRIFQPRTVQNFRRSLLTRSKYR